MQHHQPPMGLWCNSPGHLQGCLALQSAFRFGWLKEMAKRLHVMAWDLSCVFFSFFFFRVPRKSMSFWVIASRWCLWRLLEHKTWTSVSWSCSWSWRRKMQLSALIGNAWNDPSVPAFFVFCAGTSRTAAWSQSVSWPPIHQATCTHGSLQRVTDVFSKGQTQENSFKPNQKQLQSCTLNR